MDGRDIGTVVLPNATVKIFFNGERRGPRSAAAGPAFCRKGQTADYDTGFADICRRDRQDNKCGGTAAAGAGRGFSGYQRAGFRARSFQALKAIILARV